MITGTSKSGFSFEVPEGVLNDWRLLRLMRKIDRDAPELIVDLAELLLGDEQLEDLEDFMMDHTGAVSMVDMCVEVESILTSCKQGKNSEPSPA